MKTAITPIYTFNPSAGTLNLSGISGFNVDLLYSVVNLSTAQPIYIAGESVYGFKSLSGTTLTLVANLAGMTAGDQLQIIYDVAVSGGSGGGGGGAVTAVAGAFADGAIATIGTEADAAWGGPSGSTNATLISIEKAEYTLLSTISINTPPLNADGGSPVHVANFPATQPVSGTFWQAIQPVSLTTLPLPNGAATAANQTNVQSAAGTSASTAFTIQGAAAGVPVPVSATAWPLPTGAAAGMAQGAALTSQTGVLSQAAVLAAVPSYTSGTANPLVMTSGGLLKVSVSNVSGNNIVSASNTGTAVGSNIAAGQIYSSSQPSPLTGYQIPLQSDSAGSTHVAPTPSADPNNGFTAASANGSSLVAKASAGNYFGHKVTMGATAGFLCIVNATAAPASGAAITPLIVDVLAANATTKWQQQMPDYFSTGIVFLISSSTTTYTPVTPLSVTAEVK